MKTKWATLGAETVIRTMDDVINYLNRTKKAGYILAVDFRKAFDSISKDFLSHVFKAFGFGVDFQKWVSVLTKGTASCKNHGGWVSDPFEVLCGIRHGCPFSPLALYWQWNYWPSKLETVRLQVLMRPLT